MKRAGEGRREEMEEEEGKRAEVAVVVVSVSVGERVSGGWCEFQRKKNITSTLFIMDK